MAYPYRPRIEAAQFHLVAQDIVTYGNEVEGWTTSYYTQPLGWGVLESLKLDVESTTGYSDNRIVLPKAGYYQLNGKITVFGAGSSGFLVEVHTHHNGTAADTCRWSSYHVNGADFPASGGYTVPISCKILVHNQNATLAILMSKVSGPGLVVQVEGDITYTSFDIEWLGPV
jgi:hypothetical protein